MWTIYAQMSFLGRPTLTLCIFSLSFPQGLISLCVSHFQAFGGAGLSSDQPLAQFWSWARILRLADGPDEVHLGAVAKREVKKANAKEQ